MISLWFTHGHWASFFLSYTCTLPHLYISNQFKHCHWNKYLTICAHLSEWSVDHLTNDDTTAFVKQHFVKLKLSSITNNEARLDVWNTKWISHHAFCTGMLTNWPMVTQQCQTTLCWTEIVIHESLEGKPTKYFCAGIWSDNYPSNWRVISWAVIYQMNIMSIRLKL